MPSSGIRADFLSVYFRQEEARGREHSDTHQVVSERDSVCILQTEEARGRQSC
jgi:hypothetical protein